MEECPIAAACVSVAKEVFSIHNLRFGQLEAVVSAVEKQDSMIVLPTGAGKSRCFQLVPSVLKRLGRESGLVIVIQPLIALLRAQVKELEGLGLNAGFDADVEDRDPAILKKARSSNLDFCKTFTPLLPPSPLA